MMRKCKLGICYAILILAGITFFLPLVMVFAWSFLGEAEAADTLGAILGTKSGYAKIILFPKWPTVKYYIELLFDTPKFFVMFWNSWKQIIPVLLGHVFIGMPAAWAFSQYQFKGRKPLLFLYTVLMILPFQVTMVSSYLVLDRLHLMNTMYAIILPNLFSTFPVFIMVKFFSSIPMTVMEAARMDGASEILVFLKIGIPLGKPGVLSVLMLGFLEYFNNLEQPMTFLRERSKWPLSLFTSSINQSNIGISMVASVITMIPALFIFLSGEKYLEQGIAIAGMKE